jgi:hypothetical protein
MHKLGNTYGKGKEQHLWQTCAVLMARLWVRPYGAIKRKRKQSHLWQLHGDKHKERCIRKRAYGNDMGQI